MPEAIKKLMESDFGHCRILANKWPTKKGHKNLVTL